MALEQSAAPSGLIRAVRRLSRDFYQCERLVPITSYYGTSTTDRGRGLLDHGPRLALEGDPVHDWAIV
jgi:hypothetical protein